MHGRIDGLAGSLRLTKGLGDRVDVFDIHGRVIADYRAFTSAFVEVRDQRIREFVEGQFERGVQWPTPWLSLNPNFESGGSVTALVEAGVLHPENERIFRFKADPE